MCVNVKKLELASFPFGVCFPPMSTLSALNLLWQCLLPRNSGFDNTSEMHPIAVLSRNGCKFWRLNWSVWIFNNEFYIVLRYSTAVVWHMIQQI
jgi:hypothetical protein